MIAVMGASGNVGSKLTGRLLQEGQDVRVFGRSPERLEPLGQRGAEVVVGDAINLDDLRMLFGLEDANVLSLRAAWHMENLLAAVPMVQEQRMNGSVIRGDLRFPMIATVDIAERAAEHLLRRDFTGHTVETLLGPEDRSMEEATRALGEALGIRDLPYVKFPPEGVKRTPESTTPIRLEAFLKESLSR